MDSGKEEVALNAWYTRSIFSLLVPALVAVTCVEASASPTTKHIAINGVDLVYLDEGVGRPVVFVHGAMSDGRVWEGQRAAVAANYRFIAPTMRYFGTSAWPDEGRNFSIAIFAQDLASFIEALNAGPVDLVAWSYGGPIALTTAVQHPQLVRGIFLYEPASLTFVTDPDALKLAADDRKTTMAPIAAASKAGDNDKAVLTALSTLGGVGFLDGLSERARGVALDNARTMPLLFAAPPPPSITCEQLGQLGVPFTVARGEATFPFYRIASDAAAACVRGSQRIVIPGARHTAPIQMPEVVSAAILDFLSTHQ
jgi:pimeloyl-ACP methyl ester carboxylesterase